MSTYNAEITAYTEWKLFLIVLLNGWNANVSGILDWTQSSHVTTYVSILIENSAGIIVVNVKWNYNDVRLLSIKPVIVGAET